MIISNRYFHSKVENLPPATDSDGDLDDYIFSLLMPISESQR